MTTRKYSSRSQQTTLSAALTSTATSATVVSGTSLMGGATISTGQTYTVVIDPDTALEEIVDVTSVASNSLVITRGIDGSSGQAHSAGAVVRHMAIGRDYREANTHIEASTGIHGIAATSSIVGTTDTQELTNKTLTSPIINNPTLTSTGGIDVASIVFEGTTGDAYETTLTVVDPTADRTVTLPNATGTVVLKDTVDTLTNKTLTSPTISGSPVITGLSSAGMSSSSAAPKDYVDSILGSATAASTSAASAATSATSAATSATNSATSATSSAASATSSATSATASATSATSAATSASSSATSATSSATSATAAATSATSAATSATSSAASATSAANSVSTIASYASAASTSATSAATSATSSATSATASATSATASATSATASATSATSAATSATSASTSASSSATSATAASTSAASAVVSATSSATSATAAATSATSAATSATSSATSATAAATSATNAATSASSASTSASSAVTSASSAATSATNAATSATSAATTYTNYDARYLGSKATAPTVDNLGGTLLTGATYWNTALTTMYVWSGSAWSAISSSTSYSAPTLGSTPIPSAATVTTIAGLTLTNPTINNFILGYSTIATAAGTTTLTNSSNNQQIFTGTSTQIVVMPVASTMTIGTRYVIENNSTGDLTVNSSGSNLIATVIPGTSIKITSILASGTTAASWDVEFIGFNTLTGTGANVLATSPTIATPTLTGTVTASGDITLSASGGFGSIKDYQTLNLMGAL